MYARKGSGVGVACDAGEGVAYNLGGFPGEVKRRRVDELLALGPRLGIDKLGVGTVTNGASGGGGQWCSRGVFRLVGAGPRKVNLP